MADLGLEESVCACGISPLWDLTTVNLNYCFNLTDGAVGALASPTLLLETNQLPGRWKCGV